MTTTPRHIAVVLAAGSGRRTGLDTPKQFCPLAGHPLVTYSLTAFERHPDITETAVIIHPIQRKAGTSILLNIAGNSFQ